MNSKNTKRAFKGVMLNFYFDFRKYLIIGALVILIITLIDFFGTIKGYHANNYLGDTSGIFIIGFIVMLIAQGIFILQSSSSNGIRKKFMFPINRISYAAATFISIILGSLAMLMAVTMIAPIEMLLFKVGSLFSKKIIYISTLTISNFITGFISSWAYMVASASIVHLILVYFKIYKITGLIVLVAIIIISYIINIDIAHFIIMENNFGMLILKLSVISISSHLLAFIPTRNMEVV